MVYGVGNLHIHHVRKKAYLLMKKLPSPFITQFFNEKGEPLFSSLDDFLEKYIAILEAVKELHEKGIVHGDINLKNICFDAKHNKAFLCDFGAATLFDTKAIDGKDFQLRALDDVFDLGQILKEIILKMDHLGKIDPIYLAVSSLSLPEICNRMISQHKKERPTINEVIKQLKRIKASAIKYIEYDEIKNLELYGKRSDEPPRPTLLFDDKVSKEDEKKIWGVFLNEFNRDRDAIIINGPLGKGQSVGQILLQLGFDEKKYGVDDGQFRNPDKLKDFIIDYLLQDSPELERERLALIFANNCHQKGLFSGIATSYAPVISAVATAVAVEEKDSPFTAPRKQLILTPASNGIMFETHHTYKQPEEEKEKKSYCMKIRTKGKISVESSIPVFESSTSSIRSDIDALLLESKTTYEDDLIAV